MSIIITGGFNMKKTTLYFPAKFHKRLKVKAVREETSMTDLLVEAAEQQLFMQKTMTPKKIAAFIDKTLKDVEVYEENEKADYLKHRLKMVKHKLRRL